MERTFTTQEVALRDGKNGNPTWMIYRDGVYDITEYLKLNEHPGGNDMIVECAGKDATKEMDDFGHSKSALAMLKKYKIGELNQCDQSKFQKQSAENFSDGLPEKRRSKKRMFIFCG
ncbi:cytochrome b5-like [Uranotaenia lowii]|uniref:cytochrome b5-like n=1 Tax=Uranotaenia lowii TaxID=190385 RepID=UPI00247A0C70|nr:cytochrome b5-like [Uranotaenia lowii]